mmetsp:Transcript_42390/g.102013  ORF Transcript_42390/g.102013 Transcript_42390/m.102013 type:complete len:472 (-) Transcript_42390:196-1611(-)
MRCVLASLCISAALDPVPIHPASQYVETVGTHPNGVLQMVKAPDTQPLPVLHLKGTAAQRGEAAGVLMAETIATFADKVFDDYVVALVQSVDLHGLPDWLATLIKQAVGKKVAVPVLTDALKWVSQKQDGHVHDAHDKSTQIFDEIAGIAKGVCDTLGADACQSRLGGQQAFTDRIKIVNYLPELIRMSCSMVGATKTATTHGSLVQLRSLDFGAVPFSNYGMMVVHHQEAKEGERPDAFAMVSFPGFVGAVTGLNSAGLVQSEKVSYNARSAGYNQTCIKPGGVDIYGCVPGTYDGEGVPFVIRRFLETAPTKAAAEDIIHDAKRTWHVYLGLGDSTTQEFDVVGYAWKQTKTWTNADIANLTNQTHIKDVTYVDMHVQPRSQHEDDLSQALEAQAGKITGDWMASYVPHATGSGDVHHMVVDHGLKKFYVAMGTTTPNGTTFIRKACDAPVVSFDLDELWTMPTTSVLV